MLPTGTIARYEQQSESHLPRVGAPQEAVLDLLRGTGSALGRGGDSMSLNQRLFIIVPLVSALCNIFLLLTVLSARKNRQIYAFMELLGPLLHGVPAPFSCG